MNDFEETAEDNSGLRYEVKELNREKAELEELNKEILTNKAAEISKMQQEMQTQFQTQLQERIVLLAGKIVLQGSICSIILST